MTLLGRLVLTVAIGLGGTLLVAGGLIVSDRPQPDLRAADGQGLRFDVIAAPAPDVPLQHWTTRDGARLGYRQWSSGRDGAPLVVAVHGSGWHGGQFRALGARLAAEGLADVVAPDLRGHGPAPQRRGDLDHVGQFEEDLADLIAHVARPGQRVVLLGHSSGGGLVVRMAGGPYGALMQGAVLLAPFLQHDAPTARPGSGGWARVMVRRIIGLTMLNALRIRALNHLPVIQFRFPSSVLDGPSGGEATRAYSYQLNTSYAPRRDWRRDVAGLPPFLLVAGQDDEAFVAAAYEPAMAPANPNGRYRLVPAGHLDVVDSPDTFDAIRTWLAEIR